MPLEARKSGSDNTFHPLQKAKIKGVKGRMKEGKRGIS